MTTALDVRGLTRRFGNDLAVDGVDLTVRHGEIHAIVGLNGAGKTTLMRLLLGMLRPDAGEAKVLGQDSIAAGPEVWSRVGHLIETPFAYPELSVRENVMASASLGGLSLEDAAASADRVIHQFELTAWTSRRAAHLSLGNRQRLGLASALVHGPSVLVLDEPANALDPTGGRVHPRVVAPTGQRRSGRLRLEPPLRPARPGGPFHNRVAPRKGRRFSGAGRSRPRTALLRPGTSV